MPKHKEAHASAERHPKHTAFIDAMEAAILDAPQTPEGRLAAAAACLTSIIGLAAGAGVETALDALRALATEAHILEKWVRKGVE